MCDKVLLVACFFSAEPNYQDVCAYIGTWRNVTPTKTTGTLPAQAVVAVAAPNAEKAWNFLGR